VFHKQAFKQEIKQAMKNPAKAIFVIYLLAGLIPNQILAISSVADFKNKIPVLDPTISPLDPANRDLLFKRLIATFDYKYEIHRLKNSDKNLADGSTIYYLRQELQALIDMWRATDNPAYLEQAKKLVFKAIADSKSNQHQLLWHNQSRGNWPCFFSKGIEKATGGHGQLYDFQGSAGFMMVANALNQAQESGWKEIADFVEKQIVEKWLFRDPNIKLEDLTGPKSAMYLLITLDSGRDKREHFATICMDLHKLGYRKYPYKQWAEFLTDLYIGVRISLDQPAPGASELGKHTPNDWGVIPREPTGGYVWHWMINWREKIPVVQDTSHANRTVWLAAKAYDQGLIDRPRLEGFINTLKFQIWAPAKGPFYFNNFIDGNDRERSGLGPGRAGNVWFGWHRLAAYDQTLKELYISIAYDLTNNGPNIVGQNKGMEEAPLCFYAWAARLLSPNGDPKIFP
jgi:hypothetical protein